MAGPPTITGAHQRDKTFTYINDNQKKSTSTCVLIMFLTRFDVFCFCLMMLLNICTAKELWLWGDKGQALAEVCIMLMCCLGNVWIFVRVVSLYFLFFFSLWVKTQEIGSPVIGDTDNLVLTRGATYSHIRDILRMAAILTKYKHGKLGKKCPHHIRCVTDGG